MPKADAAAADEDTDAPNEAADNGATGAEQTQGDQPDARSQDTGRQADAGDDDSLADSDPLLLAQQEPTSEKAKPEPAAAKPASEPAAKPDQRGTDQPRKPEATTPKAEPSKPDQKPEAEVDEDEQLSTSDLSKDDWDKLSHKGKSQFLAQRKVLKGQRAAAKEAKELAVFRDDYQLVERFVRDQGLEDDEYRNGVIVAGAAKRNDPQIIPLLEETVARIRKAAGLPEPVAAPAQPAAPAVDADELLKLLDEAESSFDFTALRDRVAKLKGPATTPTATQQPAAAAKPPAPAVTAAVAQRAPVAAPDSSDEMRENMATVNALVALGVPEGEVVQYARGLIGEIAKAGQIPAVGTRLQAVLRAHKARQSVATPAKTRPSSAPLSGRGGPVAQARRSDSNAPVDPLKHALGR